MAAVLDLAPTRRHGFSGDVQLQFIGDTSVERIGRRGRRAATA